MSFEAAYKKVHNIEGGYVNDPIDSGGETFAGIARNFHRNWAGWQLVDQIKASHPRHRWNVEMLGNVELMNAVRGFYKRKFWDVWKGDQVNTISERVAEEIYECGVNMGYRIAVKFLQRALNLLDRNGSSDIAVDGIVGPATLARLEAYMPRDEKVLLGMLNVLQGYRYIEIMESRPTQERYARGWFRRVTLV